MGTKRTYTPEYKSKIVLEILEGEKTISEIAAREELNENMLKNWKKEFIRNAFKAFGSAKEEKAAKKAEAKAKAKEEEYQKTIGQLTVEVNWLKKNLMNCSDPAGRRSMVTSTDELTVKRQCELLEINRATLYYKPVQSAEEALMCEEYIKGRIDHWRTYNCTWGHRKLCQKLRREDGIDIGRKLVLKYMKEMNIYTVYPKPNLSRADKNAHKMPYLLKNMKIDHSNQVWAVDITYIQMGRSHMYLTAVIDWNTRFIVGYELSDTLDTAPVLEAVKKAIDKYGKPEIINSDQGSQFTSDDYVNFLKKENIRQSMDGKARWVDNVVIERWFRSLKCELIYINEFNSPKELRKAIGGYVHSYNTDRPHESLEHQYPADLYFAV